VTGDSREPAPTVEQTMKEIRAIFRRMDATNEEVMRRVIKLAELRGVDLSAYTGRKLE
jgi:hypothetical protein